MNKSINTQQLVKRGSGICLKNLLPKKLDPHGSSASAGKPCTHANVVLIGGYSQAKLNEIRATILCLKFSNESWQPTGWPLAQLYCPCISTRDKHPLSLETWDCELVFKREDNFHSYTLKLLNYHYRYIISSDLKVPLKDLESRQKRVFVETSDAAIFMRQSK